MQSVQRVTHCNSPVQLILPHPFQSGRSAHQLHCTATTKTGRALLYLCKNVYTAIKAYSTPSIRHNRMRSEISAPNFFLLLSILNTRPILAIGGQSGSIAHLQSARAVFGRRPQRVADVQCRSRARCCANAVLMIQPFRCNWLR